MKEWYAEYGMKEHFAEDASDIDKEWVDFMLKEDQ